MNDYYYKLIIQYIHIKDRVILNRNNRYLMGEKKKKKWLNNYILIIVHNGFACFRYCICNVADFEDLYNYYIAVNIPRVTEEPNEV